MSYYFIAQININDPAEYQKYLDMADEVFNHYKGEYLVVDDAPLVIEGTWNYTRTVLIRFDTEALFNEWYYSAAYQEILKYRLNAAQCNTVLAKGLKH
jgi:uncharacterized protein (DUF1330 family)